MNPAGRRAFIALYAISGGAGLVYEVAWTRLLTLQLGHTVAAASTVHAADMGGLALGAWIGGQRIPAREARATALRIYATLEITVAFAAVLLPAALHAFVPTLAWAYADGTAPLRFNTTRIAISLFLVGIPAAAMGATFPMATSAAAAAPADAARLYAANTVGAAVGALAAGFWLLPALGLRGTTWIGVSLNVTAAAGAMILSARFSSDAATATPSHDVSTPTRTTKVGRPRPPVQEAPKPIGLAATAAAISGFSALVYEVAWTRLIALVIGPTTYAFATMVASFITGLAAGASLGTRIARRTEHAERWLTYCLAAGATAAVLASWYTATEMPLSVAARVSDPAADFSSVVWQQAFGVGFVLLPVTLALGAAFPLALQVGTTKGGVVRDAALVYTANTVGAIVGALSAGFALIPALGLRNSIRASAMMSVAGSVSVLLVSNRASRGSLFKAGALTASAATMLALGVVWAAPGWDPALLASGAYKYAPYLAGTDLAVVLRAGRLQYYKEGATGTVSVRDLTGTRSLAIDGKVDASNSGDMLTQRLLGLLPVLVHGHAQDVAIVGLGSGVTAGTTLSVDSVKRVDVIEISPEVVEASRYFEKQNGNLLKRPEVRVIVGDGRSHLQLTPRQYDVLVSEPSNPWMAGVASLFTREFFEAARNRLKPDGVICQWAHTYDIQPEDLKSIVRTFASVFPEGSMWLVGPGDLLLIGVKSGKLSTRLEAVGVGSRAAAVQAALADVGAPGPDTAFALLSLFAGGPADLDRFADAAPIQTDDRTALEYSAPRGIYGRSRDDNAGAIRALRGELPPVIHEVMDAADDRAWTARGTMDLRAQAFSSAYDAFQRALARNARNVVALGGLSDAAGASNKLDEEKQWLIETAAREPSNVPVRIELSRVLAVTGDATGAAKAASDALELSPTNARAAEQLASVFADAGDEPRLSRLSEQLVSRFPEQADSWYYQATTLFLAGRTAEAIAAARRVIEKYPDHDRVQGLLGAACAAAGQRECAQMAFDASIRDNPRDSQRYVNAGMFQLQIANPLAAESYFASALAIDPSSQSARQGLAQSRELLGKR
jgi:spermidine synthase